MATTQDDTVADLRRANAELQRRLNAAVAERDENEAQKAALAEILTVINASPGNLALALDAILEKAVGLCGAAYGMLYRYDGEFFRAMALHAVPAAYAAFLRDPVRSDSRSGLGRLAGGERLVHLPDIRADAAYLAGDPLRISTIELGGARTLVTVPLRKKEVLLGAIVAYRQEVRPFSEKQITLLENFAAQAVIAMENARLINEQREALERQTATAEVLQVINASPGHLAPVFDAILDKAHQLCGSAVGSLVTYDGELFRTVATHGFPDQVATLVRRPFVGSAHHQELVRGERFIHIPDAAAIEWPADAEVMRASVGIAHVRTILFVPLRKDDTLLGFISANRLEVRPFLNKEIALVENFAAQAVIAMENARLLDELRQRTRDLQESLEYQTATSDVLKVISRAAFDLQPVLSTLLKTAARLCDADTAGMTSREDDAYRVVATFSNSPAFDRFIQGRSFTASRASVTGRTVLEGRIVQIADLAVDPEYAVTEAVALGGVRTLLGVPLLREGDVTGVIILGRFRVQPFTDRQIEIIRTFADQAVIAMENARLLTEQREALEQQTATAEVLGVINASPGNLAPVFHAMLEKAMRLCEAQFGVLSTYDGERFRRAAAHGMAGTEAQGWPEAIVPDPGSALERVVKGDRVVHIVDLIDTDAYRQGVASRLSLVETTGARTALWVALRKDDALLGVFVIYRREVRAFSEKQIALVENFAAQAVIAIENARLITEQREALEQQTATAEVLQVINASPGNLGPVFDAMLEKAMHLCGAVFGSLAAWDGEYANVLAMRGFPPALAEYWAARPRIAASPVIVQLAETKRPLQLADVMAGEGYRSGHPDSHAVVHLGGARTHLHVPLRKDEAMLGCISVYRQEVRAFTDKQIALLENFAAQAVIAMENARLIAEQREALEQQTATAEVLRVINRSPGELVPVFHVMLEKATALCEAAFGTLVTYDGERFTPAAAHGVPTAFADFRSERGAFPPPPGSSLERVATGEDLVHIANVATDPGQAVTPLVELGGCRTLVCVALRKDEALIGAITVYRQEVRQFTEKQIALLQNFAAQAVIAMENARLITETREALEQQTATAEVLQVINASPADLTPVFDTMLERAMRLCDAAFGSLLIYDGENLQAAALRSVPEEFASFLREPIVPEPGTALAQVIDERRIVHWNDARTQDAYLKRAPLAVAGVEGGGVRTLIGVPLVKDGHLLGIVHLYRQEVRPFTDKHVALLQNFAAQAVIAMQNARLIAEQREALEQQTATAEVLQVINRSPGNLSPVFHAILQKAHSLCGVAHGSLELYDGEFFRTVAVHGLSAPFADQLRQGYRAAESPATRPLLAGDRFTQIADAAEVDHPVFRKAAELEHARTVLFVPLRKDDALLGMIASARREVRPFSDKEIALLENFAAQAVIAMENARLITETHEALEQQTATAEVLQVINSSPGDLAPVFEAMLERAMRLCEAAFGVLWTYDGDRYHATAVHGAAAFTEFLRQPRLPPYHPGSGLGRMLSGEDVAIHNDMSAEEIYRSGDPLRRAIVDFAGARSAVTVSLRKDGALLGAFTIYRQEVRPFSDKQIALLRNFAAQAVIAMENARLLDEIRQRQAELRVTFDNMGDGVVMFDERLRLAAWNRNFQRLLDLPDALLAERRSYADYVRILAERGEFGTEDVEAALSRRLEDIDLEFRSERTRPDGRVIEVRRNAVPGGGFVLIYSDITERKRSEAEIRAARDAAEAAYRELKAAQANLIQAEKMASLGQLTAGIAHEIKNPLNFVNNFAAVSVDLLNELKETAAPGFAALSEDQRAEIEDVSCMLTGNLEKITEHGKRADSIVKAMLEHSRGSSGERRMVDLNALIDEALNLAYHGARAQDQSFNITLERDFGEGIAAIEVNPQDMTRVFLNIFSNGFYAARGRSRQGRHAGFVPMLKVSSRDGGEAVEIRVWDNGPGIPANIRDRLFQPFFTTKPTGEGTGLGLSITYDIVTQQHGGSITVDSKVGEYSEFTIRLPRNL
jgi:GAF domain-containing protein